MSLGLTNIQRPGQIGLHFVDTWTKLLGFVILQMAFQAHVFKANWCVSYPLDIDPMENKSALVQQMLWGRGDKPSPEPMMTHNYDSRWRR